MKRFLLIMLLFTAATAGFAFSPSQSSMGIGFGWGNFFENTEADGNTAKSYMSSPGITLDTYQFWNGKNIGLFVNVGILFPANVTTDMNGVKTDADLSIYDFLMQDNMILGPGFRYGINDRVTLLAGFGLDFLLTAGSYNKNVHVGSYIVNISYGMLVYNFGIGGDAAIKFDITDIVFLQLGTTLAWDPFCYTLISTNVSSVGNQTNWASNYSMLSFRPYLCIGFNGYVTEPGFFNSKLGKPR